MLNITIMGTKLGWLFSVWNYYCYLWYPIGNVQVATVRILFHIKEVRREDQSDTLWLSMATFWVMPGSDSFCQPCLGNEGSTSCTWTGSVGSASIISGALCHPHKLHLFYCLTWKRFQCWCFDSVAPPGKASLAHRPCGSLDPACRVGNLMDCPIGRNALTTGQQTLVIGLFHTKSCYYPAAFKVPV